MSNESNPEVQAGTPVSGGFKVKPWMVGAAVAVIAVGSFGSYWAMGTSKAKKEVRRAINSTVVGDFVDYESVSFNPLSGDVTINEFTIIKEDVKKFVTIEDDIQIDSIVIRDYVSDRDEIVMDVSIVGLNVVYADLNRTRPMRPILQLIKPVINSPSTLVDIDTSFNYQLDDEELSLDYSVRGSGLGKINYSLELENVPETNLEKITTNLFLGEAPEETIERIMRKTRLVSIAASYEDLGAINRYKQLEALRNVEPGQSIDELAIFTDEDFEVALDRMVQKGMDEDIAEDIIDAVKDFTESPETIGFEMEPDDSIKLSKLKDFEKDLPNMLEDLNFEIHN